MPKSKSAYSVPTKKGKIDTHIFVVWVDNEAGVLARVVGLFSGRGYNIESLAVAEIDHKKNLSRVTITSYEGVVIDNLLQDVKNAVDGISQFPAGAEKPTVFGQTSRGMGGMSNVVGFYSLSGKDDLWELKKQAEKR